MQHFGFPTLALLDAFLQILSCDSSVFYLVLLHLHDHHVFACSLYLSPFRQASDPSVNWEISKNTTFLTDFTWFSGSHVGSASKI